MPAIYSKYHDSFIERFLSSLDIKSLSKERYFFGKNKMNYIFKTNSKLKVKFLSLFIILIIFYIFYTFLSNNINFYFFY